VLLVKALSLKVMHGVVGVVRWHMTTGALALPEEYFLAVDFGGAGFGGV